MDRFDVAVVGARCAGSPLATMLARHGFHVCLLDRARFPSETPSTHVIQPCGVEILNRMGVLDAILTAGAVPLDRFTMVVGDVRIEATGETMYPGLCVRRVTLDALLVEAARDAGADVRTGSRVNRLVMDDGRVAGVETDGEQVHAQLVVGADGRHSTIASLVGASEYHVAPPGRLAAWAYFEGVTDCNGHAWMGRIGDLGYLAAPTDGGLYMVAITTSFAKRAQFQADRDAYFTAGIQGWPELADVLAGARRVGPIRVVTNWYGYFRQAAGPGWVLVGDAGHFKDPTPGQGISDALRQTVRLAEAIQHGVETSLDSYMTRWWRWRDKDAYEMYWFAHDLGAPGVPTPLNVGVLRDIAGDTEEVRTFLRVLNHEVRPSELFTTTRAVRAAARTLRDNPDQMFGMLREIVTVGRQTVRRARHRRARLPNDTRAGTT